MQAHSAGRLVPVMIEACKRPILFELTHTADLIDWHGEISDPRWQDFVAGLRRFVGATAPPTPSGNAIGRPLQNKATGARRWPRIAPWLAASLALVTASVLSWSWQQGREPTGAWRILTPRNG